MTRLARNSHHKPNRESISLAVLLIHLLLIVCVTVSTLSGASTKVWELSEYQDFLAGKFENISLGQEGGLSIAPALTPLPS